jgi:hypothetical protein
MRSASSVKLGPEGYTRIAIIGSAPSSSRKGPYEDKSWAIWGCSPGAYGVVPFGRSDAWFELHRWEPPTAGDPNNAKNVGWFSPEYVQFLERHEGPVFLAGPNHEVENPVPSVKSGIRFPFEDYLAKYGPYHFTSSMAWMLAHAIELLAPRAAAGEQVAVGLWGVDMAALSEYNLQRPACQHWLGLARQLGIQVILPPESDLAQPPTLYGISEYHPRHSKAVARLAELQQREGFLAGQIGNMDRELTHLRGAIDNHKYWMNTWVDEVDPGVDITSAVSLAGVALSRAVPTEAALAKFEDPPAVTVEYSVSPKPKAKRERRPTR